MNFIGFIICAIIIFITGRKLTFYGETIAELSGLGKAWIGFVLLASVTSLPELVVGVSSSAIVHSADLAVGDVLGSCAFNLGILAMMDNFVPERKSIFGEASQSNVLTASLSIILIALAGIGIYLPNNIIITSDIGLISAAFIVIYFISVRLLYKFENRSKTTITAGAKKPGTPNKSLRKAIGFYILFALVIILAALALPLFASGMSKQTGLGNTFTGTLFLAATTSLPEIAVSFAAVRRGSIDLLIGNLLGSNIFNIFILALDDIWYKGGLLKDASDANLLSVLFIILMSAIAIISTTYHSRRKRYWMGWDAVLIFSIYILNMILLYILTA